MDVVAVRECVRSSLDANADNRRQAELQLKQAEVQKGFVLALLDIVGSDPNAEIRLAAVLYLKNKVIRAWTFNEDYPKVPAIDDEDKVVLRDRLVPTLASSTPQVRQQLLHLIGKVLHYDFPQAWPGYMDVTMQLLGSSDIQSVYTGLQCLLSLCRVYRFKQANEKREEFDRITQVTFPTILAVANKLVDETSTDAGEMLKMIIKTYKHAVYFELAPHLREDSSIVPWATLFIKVVQKTPPPESMSEDLDSRESHAWWKAKKWAYSNLNRLFVRYGNPTSMTTTSSQQDYEAFAKRFIESFAPEILKAYLHEVELWVSKQQWLSKICLSNIIAFLDECIRPSVTWKHLNPHVENLISHVLFPLLCQSDEDIEMFSEDPAEYLHRKINFYEEISAPDVAATNFLITLTKNRKKQTFTVLNFINGVVNRYESAPAGEKNHREKEGALRMIGTLASIILGKKSPIANQVEYFFVRHVFPEFRSEQGYLRARACDVLEKFSDLDFKDENNVVLIYENIIQCLNDPELPVRVEAALALQPLIRHNFIRMSMQRNIADIMQQLLKLANEVDVDALANVMEEFVEVFASELTPFAVQLTEQLRDTYLRIIHEVIDKGANNPEDEDTYLDDKSITALGVLQTIGTLILTLESTPNVLLHLEQILVPVITITLEHKLYDLYNEVFEIIDSCTFSAKAISDTMWGIFQLIHSSFKDRAEMYIEEMLPALDNYVSYGHQMMIQNPQYLEAIYDIIQTIFTNDRLGAVDRICGCKLAEAVLLNLRGHADQYMPNFVKIAMQCLIASTEIKSYRVHLMEMVINCIYYNPLATLQILEQHGWTNKFFSLWFSNIENFNRVHDKKLSIVAIVALIQLPPEQVPQSIQPGWPKLMSGIVNLFQTLPMAIKSKDVDVFSTYGPSLTAADRDEVANETVNYDETYDSGSDNEWDGDANWDEAEAEGGDEADIRDESVAYMEFLNNEAQAHASSGFGEFVDDDDDTLEEETLLETPLDNIEPYQLFRDVLMQLQQARPHVYEGLTKPLSEDERTVINGVVHEAEAKQLEAEAQLNTNGA